MHVGVDASDRRLRMHVVEQVREHAVSRGREPVAQRQPFEGCRLPTQVVRQIGERVSARPTVVIRDERVPAGEHDRLEQDAPYLVNVLDGEAHDVADGIVVDAFRNRHLEVRHHASASDVLERALLHVEEIGGAAVPVSLVRGSVELQIDLMNASRAHSRREVILLSQPDAVGDDAYPLESGAPRVADGVEEVLRDRWLAAGKEDVELSLWLERPCAVEDVSHIVHGELMDIRRMVGVHEARRAFQVAPVGQIDDQGQPSPGLDARGAVVVDSLVVRTRDIVPNVKRLHPAEERRIGRQNVFDGAMPGALLSHHHST